MNCTHDGGRIGYFRKYHFLPSRHNTRTVLSAGIVYFPDSKETSFLLCLITNNDDSENLASLPRFGITKKDPSSSDKSEVVVTSLFDPDEHELIQLSTYPHVHSDDDDTGEEEKEEKSNNRVSQRLVSYSNLDDSKASPILRLVLMTSLVKLKRRQQSVEVKLHAVQTLETNRLDVGFFIGQC